MNCEKETEMKIKIFTQGTDDEFDELESKVNEWLEQNKVNIVDRKMSTATGTNIAGRAFVCCTIIIFYV